MSGIRAETIGERVLLLRLRKGLNQNEFGEGPGARNFVGKVERGRHVPSQKEVEKLAEWLGVNPEVLTDSEYQSIADVLYELSRRAEGLARDLRALTGPRRKPESRGVSAARADAAGLGRGKTGADAG